MFKRDARNSFCIDEIQVNIKQEGPGFEIQMRIYNLYKLDPRARLLTLCSPQSHWACSAMFCFSVFILSLKGLNTVKLLSDNVYCIKSDLHLHSVFSFWDMWLKNHFVCMCVWQTRDEFKQMQESGEFQTRWLFFLIQVRTGFVRLVQGRPGPECRASAHL